MLIVTLVFKDNVQFFKNNKKMHLTMEILRSFPWNEAVVKKHSDAGVSLSNLNNPPEGGGFRPARKCDE